MNKIRRIELRKLIKAVNSVQSDNDLNECINMLDSILWDEQNYYDNIPENLQYSERATISEEAIDNIQEGLEYLNMALDCEDKYKFIEYLHKAVDYINDAIL